MNATSDEHAAVSSVADFFSSFLSSSLSLSRHHHHHQLLSECLDSLPISSCLLSSLHRTHLDKVLVISAITTTDITDTHTQI